MATRIARNSANIGTSSKGGTFLWGAFTTAKSIKRAVEFKCLRSPVLDSSYPNQDLNCSDLNLRYKACYRYLYILYNTYCNPTGNSVTENRNASSYLSPTASSANSDKLMICKDYIKYLCE